MIEVSNFILPAVIFGIVASGALSHVKLYEAFLKGAEDGLQVVRQIVPTLIGLMLGVAVLRASGFFELLETGMSSIAALLGFPAQILSLLAVKLFSSSAATGIALDIMNTYGPDSYPGLITGIMMSCTETVFYTMSVYFLAAKVTRTRYTLAGALLSMLAGSGAAVFLAHLITS